jgi:hypothetical protein
MEQDHVRTLSTLRMGMVSTQGRTAIYAACALPFNGPAAGFFHRVAPAAFQPEGRGSVPQREIAAISRASRAGLCKIRP